MHFKSLQMDGGGRLWDGRATVGAELSIVSEMGIVFQVLGNEDKQFQAAVAQEELADGSTMGVMLV